MNQSAKEAFHKWIEKNNAFNMSKDEATCRFMFEIIENTTFSDKVTKERLLNWLNSYAHITVGVDLNV